MIEIGDIFSFPKEIYSDKHECNVNSCIVMQKPDEKNDGYILIALIVYGRATAWTHVQLGNFYVDCLAKVRIKLKAFYEQMKFLKHATHEEKSALIEIANKLNY